MAAASASPSGAEPQHNADTGRVENCTHPAEMLAWNDERPLYCTVCDADLQTEQPIVVKETPEMVQAIKQFDDDLSKVCGDCGEFPGACRCPEQIDGQGA